MESESAFRLGPWEVHPTRNLICGADGQVQLSPRTMEVLVYLAERAGEVVSREEFDSRVWSPAIVTDDALTRCIHDLRKALGSDPSAPRFIETIPRRGYRLAVDVQPLTQSDELPAGGAGRSLGPWILAALLVAMVAASALYLRTPGAPAPPLAELTLAVLPFGTIGMEPALPLAEGVHHDLLTRLSEQDHLRVISARSVRRYRDTDLPISDIAAELGVAWIVEGTVQQAGKEFQINVQLTEAASDTLRWGRGYRHNLSAERLFAAQGEIIEDIIKSIYDRIEPADQPAGDRMPTESLESYTRYVQGRTSLDARTEPAMRRAAEFFRAATVADPDHALAWVGLADALTLLHDYGYAAPEEVLDQARAAIDRALELNPNLAEAHASLGLYHGTRRRMSEAVTALRRAIELRPGYAEAHNWLGWSLAVVGDGPGVMESGRQSARLDPMSPEALTNYTFGYIATSQYERALDPAFRVRELQPDFTTGTLFEAWALYHLGRFEAARDLLEGLRAEWAGAAAEATLALVHIQLDRPDRARELLAEISAGEDQFAEGLVQAALGDTEAAFQSWEKVEVWGYGAALVVHHLFPDILGRFRHDPRFEAIREDIWADFGWDGRGQLL
ncbi:MAG: winged helix-turn-helix domain-containing protein [Wenzhouxiangella sp.]